MPCNSDHMNQTGCEAAIEHAAQVYIDALGIQNLPIPLHVLDANTYYAKDDRIIPQLCAHLMALSEKQLDALLYSNAKDKRRRNIANWWEKHQAADRRRGQEEREDAEEKALQESGRAKLTSAERDALGLD